LTSYYPLTGIIPSPAGCNIGIWYSCQQASLSSCRHTVTTTTDRP
jgi:hypothetical protein